MQILTFLFKSFFMCKKKISIIKTISQKISFFLATQMSQLHLDKEHERTHTYTRRERERERGWALRHLWAIIYARAVDTSLLLLRLIP